MQKGSISVKDFKAFISKSKKLNIIELKIQKERFNLRLEGEIKNVSNLTLEKRVTNLENKFSSLETRVSNIEKDVSVLKQDVSILKQDMVEVKGNISKILNILENKTN